MTYERVSTSFLTNGPVLDIDVATPLIKRLPLLDTPLFNGISDRSFTFIPSEDVGNDVVSDSVEVGSFADVTGRRVGYLRREGEPPLWWLRWELARGVLVTHLREEDPPVLASRTAQAIEIQEDVNGLPYLLFSEPLAYAVRPSPEYSEVIQFRPLGGESMGLSLSRPALGASSEVSEEVRIDGEGVRAASGTTDHGVDVRGWAVRAGQAQEMVARAVESAARR